MYLSCCSYREVLLLLNPYNDSLGLLWQMTKGDIEETLKHVCKKVLHDHSVSAHTRQRRAEALLVLGEQYVLRRVNDTSGINDFLERIGRQTGIFTTETPDFSTFSGAAGTAGASGAGGGVGGVNAPNEAFFSDALSKEALLDMQARVETSSPRELREMIALLGGGDASHCLEKSDFQKYLNELLEIRLSVVDVRDE